MAQVPPPPHADGKNILLLPRVDKRVLPASVSMTLSPLQLFSPFQTEIILL
jgi:hypothetical protein